MDDALLLQKYHGLGNDYLVLDPNKNKIHLLERHIVKLCRRNIGAGADGILYGPIWQDEKLYVKIFNPDGSEAERSGMVFGFCKIFIRCRIYQTQTV